MWYDFFAAIGLMLVFEGLLPFANPERWRKLMKSIMAYDDRRLRSMGLISMVIGLVIILVIHTF